MNRFAEKEPGNSTGIIVAALVVVIGILAWPAQARVLPQNIIEQLQARTAAFIKADGYTAVDGQTLPGDDWYTPARFPGLGSGQASAFRPDHDLDPVTRMVLLVQAREKALPHVRYRVTYRLAFGPDDYPNVHRAFIQITRFNLGPALRQSLLELADGNYPVAPEHVFGVGPHVSWRFVTRSLQGQRAAIVGASRKEISDAAARSANCLGEPCLSLTDSKGPDGDWRQPTLPQFKAPVYGAADAAIPGPARVAEYLFSYATRNGFEPAFGAFADQPQMVFVISKDVEGQDATINGLLHQPHLMDDAISDIWTRRLQAGPDAIDWRTLVVHRRRAPQLPTQARAEQQSEEGSQEQSQEQSLAQSLQQAQQQTTATPRFEDYPAPPAYFGSPGALQLNVSGDLRARIVQQMQQPATFAGEYLLLRQACASGTDCRMEFFINRRSGHALPTWFQSSVQQTGHGKQRFGEWVATARLDSRLLVTHRAVAAADGEPARYFNRYYVLREGDLQWLTETQLTEPWVDAAARP